MCLTTRLLTQSLMAVTLGLSTYAMAADTYPTKPVRLIVPFPPGGSNDIVGRLVGYNLASRLGQQVVIDNRGGAGGMIGSEIAAHAQPDGYTLLIASVAFAYNPSIFKSLIKFDPERSFVTVALLGTGPSALTVNPKLPVRTTRELIALANAKPGTLNYATAGIGSFQHLSTEMFRLKTGVNIVHVPFKGGGPAMADVIAGNTQITMGSLLQLIPHIQGGRLRVLAVGGAKRDGALPNVPTLAESGVPGYEANNWWGVLAPAGVPAAVVSRLETEISAVLTAPDMQKKFASQGAGVANLNSAAFAGFLKAETAKWSKVVRDAGIKAQ